MGQYVCYHLVSNIPNLELLCSYVSDHQSFQCLQYGTQYHLLALILFDLLGLLIILHFVPCFLFLPHFKNGSPPVMISGNQK